MWTSGCGVITAIFFRRWNSASLSAIGCVFQNTSPSLLTAISMFSGLVCRAMLVSFGSATGTVCATTGIVIKKMISSTSITSTRGVVLIAETTSSSSPENPTFMAMASAPVVESARGGGADLGTHQHAVQFSAEAAYRLHRHLVAADEPVVAQHRGHRDRQADGRHD